jgi:hypothetical protein
MSEIQLFSFPEIWRARLKSLVIVKLDNDVEPKSQGILSLKGRYQSVLRLPRSSISKNVPGALKSVSCHKP